MQIEAVTDIKTKQSLWRAALRFHAKFRALTEAGEGFSERPSAYAGGF